MISAAVPLNVVQNGFHAAKAQENLSGRGMTPDVVPRTGGSPHHFLEISHHEGSIRDIPRTVRARDGARLVPFLPVRPEHPPEETNHCMNRDIVQKVMHGLKNSGYPLGAIDCVLDDVTLVLRGRASRYYYVQIALEIAKTLAGNRPIAVRIQVA